MSKEEANSKSRLPPNFARLVASNMWLRARMMLEDEALPELGFAGPSDVDKVVMVVTAGDRLHPTKGFDFLGADWGGMEERRRFQLLDERDAAVEKIVDEVLHALVTRGYSAAQEIAKTASRYQVVFLSDSESDTEALIQRLLEVDLGTQELSDCDFGKRGAYLYFRWDENLSYFIPGDYI
jgi:hypothetical protein